MDILQPVSNCATALSSYIQGSLLFSLLLLLSQSAEAFLSYHFQRSNYGWEKSLFLVLVVAAVFQEWQTQSVWKLLLPTGCAAGKSAEPWTSYHRCNKQISVLGSDGSIPEDPRERKLSTHLSLMEALMWGQWPLVKGTQRSQCSELSPDSGNRLLMWKGFLKSLVTFMCLLLYSLKVLGSQQDRL